MKITKLTDKAKNIILKDLKSGGYYCDNLTTRKSMLATIYPITKIDLVNNIINTLDNEVEIILLPFFKYNDYSTNETLLNRKPLLEVTTSKETLLQDLKKYI